MGGLEEESCEEVEECGEEVYWEGWEGEEDTVAVGVYMSSVI